MLAFKLTIGALGILAGIVRYIHLTMREKEARTFEWRYSLRPPRK